MAKRTVSEFFKKMIKRARSQVTEQKRTCHDCHRVLVPESMGPRQLERCPDCRGIWLSSAQLAEILEQVSVKAEDEVATVESDGHASIGNTFAPSRKARQCPECGVDMGNYKFEETGIWIDGCSDSHGIWLDEGELRLLAQRRAQQPDIGDDDHDTVIDAVSDLILGNL